MHKSLVGLAAAAALGFAAVAAPASAKADCVGCAVGAGILGGVAAGAIIGSAPYGYYGYYAPDPYPPPCVWRQVWNGYAWVRACV